MNYVLYTHAYQCLGVDPSQLNLPRTGDGIDADSIWRSPQFQEVVRKKQAIAAQLERHRNNLHPELQHKSHPPELDDKQLKRQRERKALRTARRKAMRAAAASVI